jgi:uncharacterized membrane protein
MEPSKRINAFVAYLLPVIGWLYLLVFQRKDDFAMFHLKQAIGNFLLVIVVSLGWVVVAWGITWIPYGFLVGMALFSLVLSALAVAVVSWLMGMINALRGQVVFLPIMGRMAHRLPF